MRTCIFAMFFFPFLLNNNISAEPTAEDKADEAIRQMKYAGNATKMAELANARAFPLVAGASQERAQKLLTKGSDRKIAAELPGVLASICMDYAKSDGTGGEWGDLAGQFANVEDVAEIRAEHLEAAKARIKADIAAAHRYLFDRQVRALALLEEQVRAFFSQGRGSETTYSKPEAKVSQLTLTYKGAGGKDVKETVTFDDNQQWFVFRKNGRFQSLVYHRDKEKGLGVVVIKDYRFHHFFMRKKGTYKWWEKLLGRIVEFNEVRRQK